MTTIKDLGFLGLTKGQRFKDPKRVDIEYFEVISNVCSGFLGNYFNISISHSDGTVTVCSWWETDINSVIGDYELIEETSDNDKYYWEKYQSEKPKPLCFHSNKKKVIVSNVSGYWFCPDCPPEKCDLGSLTEEEHKLAVKELYGGKQCKPDPRSRGRK